MVMMERDRQKIDLGEYKRIVTVVRKQRSKRSLDELADLMDVKPNTINLIITKLDEHPDWDDEEVADDDLYSSFCLGHTSLKE